MSPRINERITLLLDTDSLAKLRALAIQDESTMCALVRKLIKRAAHMQFNKIPLCANGHACSCPQMHGVMPPVLHQPPDAA